ncbi:efflux transporter outer membrane subunit [Phreatobacter sp. AB_2022a]|uniref:efflux transporter outer membrane subunit n=1 Tax=Phreatobacter sp. AB_2022a TaxID=3003134 RepID=UPI002286D4E5|nr:efflux transporter outer membrane subunit [Phreatobacter sp. AB_2022a]MCZ0735352.1 efflux transporter outer membrane subunit [Phreatobacter sp. AB_2022a]
MATVVERIGQNFARESRRAGVLTMVAAGFLVSGCTTDTPSRDLGFRMPARYAEAAPQAGTIAPNWWRAYRLPALTTLVETALDRNLDIQAAIARIAQAEAQIMTARAPLLPTLNGTASGSRARSSLSGFETSSFSTLLSTSWILDVFGRNRTLLEAAQASAAASLVDKDYVALVTAATVATTYFQLLTLQDRLAIAERNAASAARILGAIKSRATAGTVSDFEISQQEALTANVRAVAPSLRQQITVTRNALAILVGSTPQGFAPRGGSLASLAIPAVRPGVPSDLLQRRPDVKAAEIRLAALDANIRAARLAYFPTISLTGQGGFQSNALRLLLEPQSMIYSVAASATQTIFDTGTLRGNLELQRGLQDEALQNYRKVVLTALSDVSNGLSGLKQTAEQVRFQGEAVTAARRAFRITDDRIAAGTIDIVTLLNTQQTLFSSEDALAQARLARAQASVQLFQALGGGWTPETSRSVVVPQADAQWRPTP